MKVFFRRHPVVFSRVFALQLRHIIDRQMFDWFHWRTWIFRNRSHKKNHDDNSPYQLPLTSQDSDLNRSGFNSRTETGTWAILMAKHWFSRSPGRKIPWKLCATLTSWVITTSGLARRLAVSNGWSRWFLWAGQPREPIFSQRQSCTWYLLPFPSHNYFRLKTIKL